MQNSHLIQLVSRLSVKEMTRFHEFSLSPYFNKHQKVRNLCGWFRSIYPHFTPANCDRRLLYTKIAPDASFDQAKLDIVFTYTLRLLEQFFINEQLRNNKRHQNHLLLNELRERKEVKRYEKNLRKMQHQLGKAVVKDGEHYHDCYLLAAEADAYFIRHSRYDKAHEIVHKQANLDRFYLAEKLKDACEMTLRRNILKMDAVPDLMPEIVGHIQTNLYQFTNSPPVILYFHLYLLLNSGEKEHFNRFLPILEEYVGYFTSEEQRHIYAFAQNYCIAQINKGNTPFQQELFQLYQQQLHAGLLLENGYLSEWHFKNIVTVGLRVSAFEWVKDFLETYTSRLHPDVIKNAHTYNLANFYYHTRQYEKVHRLLLQVEYTDLRYSLDAKTMLLRTYYELDDYEPFESLSDAFRQYLKRNKLISEGRRKGYYNLLKFTQRAFRIKEKKLYQSGKKVEKAIAKLTEDIANTADIFNAKWLKEKVAELYE